jgi:hypothetical protein
MRMTKQELQQRASDKAFAKMSMLLITIEQNKEDIRLKTTVVLHLPR